MSSISSLREQIAVQYSEHCKQIREEPNKSLLRELIAPSHSAGDDSLDLIFRGNDKLNFTSRLVDRDVIVLCECLSSFGDHIRHIDLSYNLLSDAGGEAIG